MKQEIRNMLTEEAEKLPAQAQFWDIAIDEVIQINPTLEAGSNTTSIVHQTGQYRPYSFYKAISIDFNTETNG
jgi:hypothetical protein